MYPKIKFKASVKEDIENAKGFLASDGFWLDWFLPEHLKYIQSDRFTKKTKEKIIEEYTRHIYNLHKNDIESGVNSVSKKWAPKENRFFGLCERLFKGHKWPKGKYIAYASIYNMFPRYIDEKVFFFPYRIDHRFDPIATVGHEMLHFIFFDYIEKKYGLKENSTIKGRKDEYVWQVSEVFNNVVETWKPYHDIFKTSGRPYPGTEKIFAGMKKDWSKHHDIDKLLDKWLK